MADIQILIFPVKPGILQKQTAATIGQLGKKYVDWNADPQQALADQIYNEEIDMQFLRPEITSTRSKPNNLVLVTEPLIENNKKEYFEYNIDNLEQAIQRYNKTERSLGDVLSRDHDVFDNPTKTPIYAVVLLLNIEYDDQMYKFYQGHVYTWIFDQTPQNCWMIGIRNRVDTIFRRLDQVTSRTSLASISKYLLEGVRQFALSKNCIRIVVAQPLSTMKQILQKYGFKSYKIKTGEVGISPFKINALFGWFLSYDNLDQPFIFDGNIEVKIYN